MVRQKDRKIAWNVSTFDWREFERKFKDTIPSDDFQRINYTINHVPHVVCALIVDLNKRVEELESEIRRITEGKGK